MHNMHIGGREQAVVARKKLAISKASLIISICLKCNTNIHILKLLWSTSVDLLHVDSRRTQKCRVKKLTNHNYYSLCSWDKVTFLGGVHIRPQRLYWVPYIIALMQKYKSGFKVNNILLSTLLVDDFESEGRQYLHPATETGTGTSKLICSFTWGKKKYIVYIYM